MSGSPFVIRQNSPSARSQYVVDVVFKDWMDLDIRWTEEGAIQGACSIWQDDRCLAAWMVNEWIQDGNGSNAGIQWMQWQFVGKVPFALAMPFTAQTPPALPGSKGDWNWLPVDPIAATFWGLVCWHEQFNVIPRDIHGRPSSAQLPWSRMEGKAKWKTYELDVCEQHHWPWLELMWHSLMTEWGIPLPSKFSFQPTIDIDVAFKHLGRSRWKYWALQMRDLLCLRLGVVRERWNVVTGRQKDPYDTFDQLKEWHREESIWWFVLAANRSRPYDIGLDPSGCALSHVVSVLASWESQGRVCWHPGYKAMDSDEVLHEEAQRFFSLPGTTRDCVRAHFLRSQPGRDWLRWEKLGVSEDASLGWSRDVGFRSGVSRPFQAFDIASDRPMRLVVHPIAVMDSALREGLELNPEESTEKLDLLLNVVADVGGTWMSCWHNTSVSEDGDWVGWSSTYIHMISTAKRLVNRKL